MVVWRMVRRGCSVAVLPACGSKVGSWEAGQENLALYPDSRGNVTSGHWDGPDRQGTG